MNNQFVVMQIAFFRVKKYLIILYITPQRDFEGRKSYILISSYVIKIVLKKIICDENVFFYKLSCIF